MKQPLNVIMSAFLLISFALFLGMARFFILYRKPGAYPPKHVIKKQMAALGGGCVLFFLLGMLFYVW
ncbi:hypothetical protein ACF5W4_04755 [Bacillota bacterium Lsc_1132]